MDRQSVSWKLVALSLLVIMAGAVAAAHTIGLIDLRKVAAGMPVVGKLITPQNPLESGWQKSMEEIKLEELNQAKEELLTQLEQAQAQLQAVEIKQSDWQQEKQALEQQVKDLQEQVKGLERTRVSYQEMAKYYATMKPQAAVAILTHLEDETIISILQELSKDQGSKILSAMDPTRAAQLVKKMTGNG